mmetsp:Transcript_37646/g.63340  ORF Transcript_37646/g.63340 Transcript_37646/m.63340 type:complete len:395 (+) Transcript_37646:254-1438(+)|eukprot:CAMPEP_0198201936 /NCGR_PEP_ID=MMETSP1445-20131203/4965_1 /TAXON_ID=36898 /ORGANISM="Pyramimonas sp., Strain CCMP2087" /LENGTH=394 /DNA_ID=CAMNT_0043872599 /DNA_START=213 /DNA_END=1397 /DNA_ORIENTATION=-
MWGVVGRSVVAAGRGRQSAVRTSTLVHSVDVDNLQCSTPQLLVQAQYCATWLGGSRRQVFGWASGFTSEKEELHAAKEKLEARLKLLEEEASEHRVTRADLQNELQRTRSEQSSTQARLVGLEAQLKNKELSNTTEVTKAVERYAEADSELEKVRQAFKRISQLMEESDISNTRGIYEMAPNSGPRDLNPPMESSIRPNKSEPISSKAPERGTAGVNSRPQEVNSGPKASDCLKEERVRLGSEIASRSDEFATQESDTDDADSLQKFNKSRLKIGGTEFVGFGHLQRFCSGILTSTPDGEEVSAESSRVLYNLFRKGHPSAEAKLGITAKPGVTVPRSAGPPSAERFPKFVVSSHPQHKSTCFFVMRADGTSTDISFHKAISGLKQRRQGSLKM